MNFYLRNPFQVNFENSQSLISIVIRFIKFSLIIIDNLIFSKLIFLIDQLKLINLSNELAKNENLKMSL